MKPVQALVEQDKLEALPIEYVQPHNIVHQPTDAHVPVIDLNRLENGSTRNEVLAKLDSACREWGAFQVINHGIPKSVLEGMKEAAEHFYNVPVEEKMKYFVTVFDARPMRYSTSFDSTRDVVLEWKDVLRIPAEATGSEADKVWPDKQHLPREPVNEYGKRVNSLVSLLLEALSQSLGLPREYLNSALSTRERILALNFYPPCPEPERALGLGPHSDAIALTVLVQNDVEGLQLFHKGNWVTVGMESEAVLVNLGDQLQILSNGKYHSVEHRALVNREKLRISVATLVGPSKSSSIAPAPQLIDHAHPALYKSVVFQDYIVHYIKHGLNTRAALTNIANTDILDS